MINDIRYIRLTNHQPFALAGIWDKWQNHATGAESQTFSVITTEANPLMTQIHNVKKRMNEHRDVCPFIGTFLQINFSRRLLSNKCDYKIPFSFSIKGKWDRNPQIVSGVIH